VPLDISTGTIHIGISRDGKPAGEIAFDPSDVVFAEKFYRLMGEFDAKFAQYQERARAMDANTATNANGLPSNAGERIALAKEACLYIHAQIDNLFGVGTSHIVFGEALSLDAIRQFFAGVTPYIQKNRAEKLQKYTNKKSKRAL
jgi:hypothetical protein